MEINLPFVVVAPNKKKVYVYWEIREDPLLWGIVPYSQTSLYAGHPLKTDASLLQTVCFVPGKRKSLYFL